MTLHVLQFLACALVIWVFADLLIGSVSRIARRFCRTGFFTAFFLLGFLTSVSEISVAANAGLAGVPAASAGNLIGASVVLLLLVVPLLALAGSAVTVNGVVSRKSFALILGVIGLPSILAMDGVVTALEGAIALLAYGAAAYSLFHHRESINACDALEEKRHMAPWRLVKDVALVVVSAAAIFAASHFMVEQALYFASALAVPASLIGLLVLSVGTNLPELAIAARAVFKHRSDIAFGDYLGSAAMNTAVFGALALFAGPFAFSGAGQVAPVFVAGLALLFILMRSGGRLTRTESVLVLIPFAAFLLVQAASLASV